MGYIDHKQYYQVNLFDGIDTKVQHKAKYKSQDKYVFLGIAVLLTITLLIQWATVLTRFGDRL